MVRKYLQSGQCKADKFSQISADDMKKIRQYFDRSSALILQQEVLFNILLYFGLRGRESLRWLTPSVFAVKEDAKGKLTYVNKTVNFCL